MKKVITFLVLNTILLNTVTTSYSAENNQQIKKLDKKHQIVDYKKYFDQYKLKGSFLLYDLKNDKYISYNPQRTKTGFLPASTFKIINSLIGLETGVIKDENFVIKWDGIKRDIEAWNKYHSLKSAIKVSAVPYYQELARRVGFEKMKKFTTLSNYGTMDINKNNVDKFWLEGNSKISQEQQINFLINLYKNKLPFSQRSISIVKKIILLDSKKNYQLRGKTGWVKNLSGTGTNIINDDLNIGWFVGYLEQNNNVYFFATNVEANNPDSQNFTVARRAITENILKSMKLL